MNRLKKYLPDLMIFLEVAGNIGISYYLMIHCHIAIGMVVLIVLTIAICQHHIYND